MVSFCEDLIISQIIIWSGHWWEHHHLNISKVGSTHIYDDVQRFIIRKENTHTPAVLHDSVVMEVQFVHCVVGSLVVRAGLRVLGNFSGSEHSKAKLCSSSHSLQEKHRDIRLRGFHSCKKKESPKGRRLWMKMARLVNRQMGRGAAAGQGTARLTVRPASPNHWERTGVYAVLCPLPSIWKLTFTVMNLT